MKVSYNTAPRFSRTGGVLSGISGKPPMGLFSFLRKADPAAPAGRALYDAIVAQARQKAFYARLAVPDTVDGRFDMIVTHAMLVMRRLRQEGEAGAAIAQELFDHMFRDMDRSLRELGVGDMSIGKHIKKMARAFYGRAEAVERALEGSDADLDTALMANVFRKSEASPGQVRALGDYLRAAAQRLSPLPFDDLRRGALAWPAVEAAS
jgi:cytochrome b pre-mRNA-processing protein 3